MAVDSAKEIKDAIKRLEQHVFTGNGQPSLSQRVCECQTSIAELKKGQDKIERRIEDYHDEVSKNNKELVRLLSSQPKKTVVETGKSYDGMKKTGFVLIVGVVIMVFAAVADTQLLVKTLEIVSKVI